MSVGTRIAGLDGLRALAVTGVLLYHAGLAAVPGGFLGVDLFFVISGFLITTLLLAEATARGGRVDVVAFWGRRVRRLLPGLALVIVATLVVATAGASISDESGLRGDSLAALMYVANWHFLLTGNGYFEQLALPSPLLHTWSLSIEEQFYLLWPLLLLVILRVRLPRWAQATFAVAAALGSAGWAARLASEGVDSDRVYYGTDTRAQTILVGVVAAFLLQRPRRDTGRHQMSRPAFVDRLTGATALTALGGVVAAMVLAHAQDGRLYRGGSLLFAVISAVLIAAVVRSPHGALTRALEARPIRDVGALSYSLYLWHWPAFLFLSAGRTSLTGATLLAVRLLVALVLAAAAYHFVEAPIRRAGWRPVRLVAVPIGAVALTGGLVLTVWNHFPPPASRSPVEARVGLAGQAASGTGQLVQLDPQGSALGARPRASGPTTVAQTHPLRVTILGDSTAVTLGDGLRDVPGVVEFYRAATIGCGITTARPYRYMGVINPYARLHCQTWQSLWRDRVSSRPADVVVILAGRWEVADQVVDGRWTHLGTRLFDRYLSGELQKAVEAASTTGAPVVILTAPYYSRGEQPDGSIWPEDDPARVDAYNRLLRSFAAQQPDRVHVIEFGRRMSDGTGHYLSEIDGFVLRNDGVHFTAAAARWIQPWLVRHIAPLATT